MGWSLAVIRAALRVLAAHRRLLVFPIISGVASAAVIATTVLSGWSLSRDYHGGSAFSPTGWVVVAAGYGVLSFITIFCDAALVYAANEALRGTWGTNLGGTVSITRYTVIAATLGAGVIVACWFVSDSLPVLLALLVTALYRFAVDGEVPYFAHLDLSTAMR